MVFALWSKKKVEIKLYLGKIEKGVQTLKTKRHSTFIHPKEKQFGIWGFCVK